MFHRGVNISCEVLLYIKYASMMHAALYVLSISYKTCIIKEGYGSSSKAHGLPILVFLEYITLTPTVGHVFILCYSHARRS